MTTPHGVVGELAESGDTRTCQWERALCRNPMHGIDDACVKCQRDGKFKARIKAAAWADKWTKLAFNIDALRAQIAKLEAAKKHRKAG